MDIGAQIEQYRIIEHIGRGGMADVWSARDETLGRMVAIKTIARDLSSDNDPVALFQREARTIANLDHPHILPIFSFGEHQGKLYIAMRFVAGGSLEDKLQQGALTYKDTVSIGRAIAEALAFAHSENVIHLDLKPPNILLDSRDAPYLADFGLATVIGPDGRAQNPGSGTLLYMAPEQLTAIELDHRVDVYSFALVLYHMLTGKLPFSGMEPLALKQLQFKEDLPPADDINPDLPPELTDILRRGTALDPKERYESTIALMSDVEEILGLAVLLPEGAVQPSGTSAGQSTPFVEMASDFDPQAVQIQEARDIYERARQAWAGGNGRFMLSVTHFMVMSDYYIEAKKHELSYDTEGAQMLLRGALEYDYHLAHWWERLNNSDRRWVCLHAIRSENPAARIRALYRLETLPDADPPRIPKQVAQALSIETDEQAMLAAIQVLSFRGRLTEGRSDYNVKTEFQGRVLNTIAREGLQITAPGEWKNVCYSQEIDTVVAETALDGRTPAVRAAAARAVGKMRSARAVRHIVEARKRHEPGSLRALAYVLDEAPTLPRTVEFMPRFEAWVVNTWRRLTADSVYVTWTFLFAMLGGWLGMGQHIYRTYRSQTFFNSQRIFNTTAGGLFFGFAWAILTVIALTYPKRLQGFWPQWTRALWSATAAFFLGQMVWWLYAWMYLNNIVEDVPDDIITLAGVGTAVGFVVASLTRVRGWVAVLITVVFTYIPLYIGYWNFFGTPRFGMSSESFILLYDFPRQLWTVMLPLVILLALGAHFPAVVQDVRDLFALFTGRRKQADEPQRQATRGPQTVRLDRNQAIAAVSSEGSGEMPAVTVADTATVTDLRGAATEEYEIAQTGAAEDEDDITRPDRDTALDVGIPRTEEFDSDKVGGADDDAPQADTDRLSHDPNLQTALKPDIPRTEEFDSDKVGGAGNDAPQADTDRLSHDPNLQTALKPDIPRTEEFDSDKVGGADDAHDWDAMLSPLDENTERIDIEINPPPGDDKKDD